VTAALDEFDAPLGDQSPDEARLGAEPLRRRFDNQQQWPIG
jgi:hypothetical protein